jgi:protein involved in polysaccharide export with SLBB domain
VLLGVAACGLLSGCEWNDFFNPGEPQIISPDTKQKPLLVPILDTLASGVEEPDTAYSNATDIEPADLIPDISDYKIGPNDLLSISINDLMGEGTGESTKTVRVTETGMIDLLFIPPVKAQGLSEREMEQAIQKAYQDARLIRNAQVSVTVAEARARVFTIQGNVGAPGVYAIDKPDFRMLDALGAAKAPQVAIGVPYAYVIRKNTETAPSLQGEQPEPETNPGNTGGTGGGGTPSTPPTTSPSDLLTPPPPTSPTTAPGDLLAPPPTTPQGRANPSASDHRAMAMDDMPPQNSRVFRFDDVQNPTDQRIIRVPIDELRQFGELKYNVVIKPGDMIIIPDPVTGVYYIGGHVQRPGVFGLQGYAVTLKEAWVAAGGPDDFSIPGRTEVIRRVGANREVAVRVNLDKILALTEPDVYLKPNDEVYVGTHAIATFLASLRNGFRVTYGFGFLYDRNFYQGLNGF